MSSVDLARDLTDLLALRAPPIAISFHDAPPPGLPRVAVAAPAGCAYWSRAAAGERFHTVAEDHFGCAVGAYTHGAELGAAQQADLHGLLRTMADLSYLAMDEVPSIPARRPPLRVVVYAPLAEAPVEPDLILVRVPARGAMVLAEAAHAVGVRDGAASVVRPACAMIPRVLDTGLAATSYGCIGNRVYTGLGDSEVWFTLPGSHAAAIVERLSVVQRANAELEKFHRARLPA
jgi:uncharacterized protein (DUF169 family)